MPFGRFALGKPLKACILCRIQVRFWSDEKMAIKPEYLSELEEELNNEAKKAGMPSIDEIQKSYLESYQSGDIAKAVELRQKWCAGPEINDYTRTEIQACYSRKFDNMLNSGRRAFNKQLLEVKALTDLTAIQPQRLNEVYAEISKRGETDTYWNKRARTMKAVFEL
jgi:hypothetical protein